jgi:phthalate 4,5-dioxygenase oxygenase subunit
MGGRRRSPSSPLPKISVSAYTNLMLSHEDNEKLTRVGPGTPMGQLMRRYWLPALFSDQLSEPDCPPVRVKLLGENLVAFRDSESRIGLLDERCPHRTASLFFGRNEECGLRCVYHGWKFDVNGNCIDVPSEPPGNNLAGKIKIKSYPCLEQGGVVWTFMGDANDQPPFPELEWTRLPASHRFATRHMQQCNWLQGLEGGFDTSHLSFLHTGTTDGNFIVPSRHEVIPRDFGFLVGSGRDTGDGNITWSANVMLMPFHKIIATQPYGAHCWVPMDDENTMLYSVDFQPDRPLNDAEMKLSREYQHIHTENLPGSDMAVQNKSNNYLIDRELQKSGESYSGMRGLGIQDCAIQESMGPIADRSIEHLGVSDTAIIQIRKLLLETLVKLDNGDTLPGLSPEAYRVRSARFQAPPDVAFDAVVDDQIRTGGTP